MDVTGRGRSSDIPGWLSIWFENRELAGINRRREERIVDLGQ